MAPVFSSKKMVLRISGHCYKETVDLHGHLLASIKQSESICEGILTAQ